MHVLETHSEILYKHKHTTFYPSFQCACDTEFVSLLHNLSLTFAISFTCMRTVYMQRSLHPALGPSVLAFGSGCVWSVPCQCNEPIGIPSRHTHILPMCGSVINPPERYPPYRAFQKPAHVLFQDPDTGKSTPFSVYFLLCEKLINCSTDRPGNVIRPFLNLIITGGQIVQMQHFSPVAARCVRHLMVRLPRMTSYFHANDWRQLALI